MIERTVTIANKNGLHARPAAEIVKMAAKYKSDILLVRDDLEVNGKSIMGVMMLAAEYGSSLLLRADGPDEAEAVGAIADILYRSVHTRSGYGTSAQKGENRQIARMIQAELLAWRINATGNYVGTAWASKLDDALNGVLSNCAGLWDGSEESDGEQASFGCEAITGIGIADLKDRLLSRLHNEAIYLADRVIVFGARPGKVKETIKIDLARPRDLSIKRDPKFLQYEDRLWNLIEEEVKKTMVQDQVVHNINQ